MLIIATILRLSCQAHLFEKSSPLTPSTSWGFSSSQCVDSSLKSSSPVCSLNYKMNFVIFLASLYISCPYMMKSHPFVLYLFVSSWILQDSQISNGYSAQPSNPVLFFENGFLSPLLKSLDNVLFLLFALNLVHPVNLYTFIFQFWSIFLYYLTTSLMLFSFFSSSSIPDI